MTDLVGGVEPERQEWAAGQLAHVAWSFGGETHAATLWRAATNYGDEWFGPHGGGITDDMVISVEPLVAVPAGFGERLAQAIEGLRDARVHIGDGDGFGHMWNTALDFAAALVREQFAQSVSPETNGEVG